MGKSPRALLLSPLAPCSWLRFKFQISLADRQGDRRMDGWTGDYLVAEQQSTNKLQLQLQLQQCGNIINYATNVQIKHKIPKHLKRSNNQCGPLWTL